MFCAPPFSTACWSCSEPTPSRSPRRSDQRGAAPIRMRRRCEDRFVEHVFPIAGEFLLGGDTRRDRMLLPAGAGDDDALTHRGGRRLTKFERRHVELGECLDQPEPGLLIIAKHVPRHRPAVAQRKPDRVRLSDQIADGQDQAVAANDDAVTGAFGAQRFRRKRIRRHRRPQRHDAGKRRSEIVGIILRLRLHRGRHLPVADGRHRLFLRRRPGPRTRNRAARNPVAT